MEIQTIGNVTSVGEMHNSDEDWKEFIKNYNSFSNTLTFFLLFSLQH